DWPLALSTASRSRGFASRSGPPSFAATVISLMSLVNSLPRAASTAPFLRLMLAHLLWPATGSSTVWATALPAPGGCAQPLREFSELATVAAFGELVEQARGLLVPTGA